MNKTNVWGVVDNEASEIIKGIQKGEIKCVGDFKNYLDSIYNWKVSEGISRIVESYAYVNNIDLPFEIDSNE